MVVELRRGGREQEGSGGGWGKVTAPAAGRAKAGKKKGLIGFVPLQFCEFGVIPLLFVYLETCHYNFPSTRLVPFSTLESSLGPFADRIVRMELIPRLKLVVEPPKLIRLKCANHHPKSNPG